jgi:serine O-acetyltransferase
MTLSSSPLNSNGPEPRPGPATAACPASGPAVANRTPEGSDAPESPISSSEPDWSRETPLRPWDPGRRLLRALRGYQAARSRQGLLGRLVGAIASRRWVLEHRFWSVVAGADIPLNSRIAGGLLLPHPIGVVVHPEARIGPNCLLLQGSTLVGGVVLEGHVDVGAGAKVLRPVRIGAHARIGANAVVLEDVPAGATVVGIPARIAGR